MEVYDLPNKDSRQFLSRSSVKHTKNRKTNDISKTVCEQKEFIREKSQKEPNKKQSWTSRYIFEGNEIVISKRYGRACRLSRVCLIGTLWTVALQSPLSMGFPRQEYQSGLLFPSPGIFMIQGLNSLLLCILHCRQILYPLSHQGSPIKEIPTLNFLSFLKIVYWDIINVMFWCLITWCLKCIMYWFDMYMLQYDYYSSIS